MWNNLIVPLVIQSERPPLHLDADGAMRIGGSRVLLELVVHAFQDGATPEEILQQYPTLALPDVYSVITYYLRHLEEVQAYLAEREQRAIEVRERIEGQQRDISDIRDRLLARRQGRS